MVSFKQTFLLALTAAVSVSAMPTTERINHLELAAREDSDDKFCSLGDCPANNAKIDYSHVHLTNEEYKIYIRVADYCGGCHKFSIGSKSDRIMTKHVDNSQCDNRKVFMSWDTDNNRLKWEDDKAKNQSDKFKCFSLRHISTNVCPGTDKQNFANGLDLWTGTKTDCNW